MVQTPIGARCPACARLTKSPIYTLTPTTLVRAGVAALIGGLVMGIAWGLVAVSDFGGLFVMIFIGAGLGYGFTRVMEFATGRKRGWGVAAFAVAGILLAWALQPLLFTSFADARPALIAVAVGIYFAYQNLK